MSRQLKFRAWFEGHIYEVAKLDFWGDPDQASCDLAGPGENGEWEELFNIYVGEVELMQYTGLKDKNGLEVYFNDVVEDEYGHRYEVVFEGDCLRCNGIRKIRDGHKPKNRWFGIDLEIIGNRFENPKLLEEEE